MQLQAVREGLFEEVTCEWRPESRRLVAWEDWGKALVPFGQRLGGGNELGES